MAEIILAAIDQKLDSASERNRSDPLGQEPILVDTSCMGKMGTYLPSSFKNPLTYRWLTRFSARASCFPNPIHYDEEDPGDEVSFLHNKIL